LYSSQSKIKKKDHWPLCWSYYTTTLRRFPFIFCNNWNELESYLLHNYNGQRFKLCFVSSIDLHITSHLTLTLTSSPLIWNEIQTCCNITPSPCSFRLFLVDWYIMCIDIPLKYRFGLNCSLSPHNIFSKNFCLTLCKDLSEASTSTSSARCPTRTT